MPSTYTPIATTTLGSAQTSYTFSSISGTYTDLILVANGYATIDDGYAPKLVFNSDTGTNYSRTVLSGTGSAASSGRNSNQSYILCGNQQGWSTSSSNPAIVVAHIMNYSNSTTYKSVLIRNGAANGTYPGTEANAGLWRSTAAITSVQISAGASAQFATGSTFTLYGIKAA